MSLATYDDTKLFKLLLWLGLTNKFISVDSLPNTSETKVSNNKHTHNVTSTTPTHNIFHNYKH